MKGSVYDTRFFVEYFYSKDISLLKSLREDLQRTKRRYVSSVTVHELFKLVMEREGKDAARSRCETIERDFEVVDVNYKIAVESAVLRSKYRVPMADSVIAATAIQMRVPVVSDDEHFREVREVRARWR